MSSERRPRGAVRQIVLLLLCGLLAATALAACDDAGKPKAGATTTTAGGKPVKGGAIVLAVEDEPPNLNTWTAAANRSLSAPTIVAPVLSQLMTYDNKLAYQPQLLSDLPQVVSPNPFKVRFKLRPEAVWDDGSQITAADVQRTIEFALNPANDVVNRAGYTKIKGGSVIDVSPNGKEFSIEFTEPYGPWRELFAGPQHPILQASKMAGADFNTFANGGLPFSSGPFKFEAWAKGDSLALVRNDKWWGKSPAWLDKITVKFAPDPAAMVNLMRQGAAQAAAQVQNSSIASELRSLPGVNVAVTPGLIWEHLDVNLRDPVLQVDEVRKAFWYAIDREEIVDQVAKPVDPTAQVLQNVFFVVPQADYVPHWQGYRQIPQKVDQLLQSAGYSKGAQGIYEKNGQKLTITLSTTANNPQRRKTVELMKKQMVELGIDLVVQEVPPEVLFDRVPNCDYQVALFAYRGSTDPSWAAPIYSADQITCPGDGQNVNGQNSMAYRNVEVTQLLVNAQTELDPGKRSRTYNTIDAKIAEDAPTLPLYEKATLLASVPALRGLAPNPTVQGPLWNAEDWWLVPAPATTAPATTAAATTAAATTPPKS